MSTKTITVTEDAYNALKALKEPRESFSETILRVAKKRSLNHFYGVLSKETGERLEKVVMENRKAFADAYTKRIVQLKKEMDK